jgi:CHAD domain-containing protein
VDCEHGYVVKVKSDFAESRITYLLRKVTAGIRQTLRSARPDAVHDLRVSIRRFDQALLLFEPLLDRKDVRRTRRKLKQIRNLAGDIHTCDIAAQRLLQRFTAIRENLDTRRREESRSLIAALRSWINKDYSSTLKPRLKTNIENAGFGVITEGMAKDFVRLGGKAAQSGSPAALHRFRIAAKHYRYTLEILTSILGRGTAIHLNIVKAVQSRLDNVSDCETVRRMAADWRAGREIDRFLKARERQQMEKFRQEWKWQFTDPRQARRWLAALS